MGVEEVDGEDEPGGQQCFVGMDDGCHVESPAWQEIAEYLREPQHQARTADGKHTPEDGDEVEFFPVCPAFERRLRSPEQEPADHAGDVLDIPEVGHQ